MLWTKMRLFEGTKDQKKIVYQKIDEFDNIQIRLE